MQKLSNDRMMAWWCNY